MYLFDKDANDSFEFHGYFPIVGNTNEGTMKRRPIDRIRAVWFVPEVVLVRVTITPVSAYRSGFQTLGKPMKTSLKEHNMQHRKYMKYAIAVSALFVLAGCGDESISEKAGSTITGTVVGFTEGLGKGVDEKMQVTVESEPTLESNGLKVTSGKDSNIASGNASVYVVSTKPFKGNLIVKALDRSGNEIGRAQPAVNLKADDATYVDIKFPSQMDSSLVRKYSVAARVPEGA
jgi:hypothetical protein